MTFSLNRLKRLMSFSKALPLWYLAVTRVIDCYEDSLSDDNDDGDDDGDGVHR
jgi:hypothetical protein